MLGSNGRSLRRLLPVCRKGRGGKRQKANNAIAAGDDDGSGDDSATEVTTFTAGVSASTTCAIDLAFSPPSTLVITCHGKLVRDIDDVNEHAAICRPDPSVVAGSPMVWLFDTGVSRNMSRSADDNRVCHQSRAIQGSRCYKLPIHGVVELTHTLISTELYNTRVFSMLYIQHSSIHPPASRPEATIYTCPPRTRR
jgi:hypothetical protein